MTHKPISRRQMKEQVYLYLASAATSAITLVLMDERNVVFYLTIGLLLWAIGQAVYVFWRWKNYPLEGKTLDSEITHDTKEFLRAGGGLFFLVAVIAVLVFVIFA